MRAVTSSRTLAPVSSPKAARASSASVRRASGVIPASRLSEARVTASSARRAASACRALVSSSPALSAPPAGKRAATVSPSASSPAPVAALTTHRWGKRLRSSSGAKARGRSDLLIRQMTRGAWAAWAMAASSSGERGAEPSSTSRARAAPSRAARLRSTPIRSTASSVSRRPAVSMSRSTTPPSRHRASTVSRVVPGTSVTMARS